MIVVIVVLMFVIVTGFLFEVKEDLKDRTPGPTCCIVESVKRRSEKYLFKFDIYLIYLFIVCTLSPITQQGCQYNYISTLTRTAISGKKVNTVYILSFAFTWSLLLLLPVL